MSKSPAIEVIVNGETQALAPNSTVADLIARLDLTPERLALELNLEILPRNAWDSTELNPGDRLEIVHFVGGG